MQMLFTILVVLFVDTYMTTCIRIISSKIVQTSLIFSQAQTGFFFNPLLHVLKSQRYNSKEKSIFSLVTVKRYIIYSKQHYVLCSVVYQIKIVFISFYTLQSINTFYIGVSYRPMQVQNLLTTHGTRTQQAYCLSLCVLSYV